MATITDNGGVVLTDERGQPLLDEASEASPVGSDYADATLAHLPSGRAWNREGGSVLSRLIGWLAPTASRLADRALALLSESPAGSALVELLPEWEDTLGLPDPCAGAQPTVALRQAAVRAKLAARGGQSVGYYQAVAAQIGTPIIVQEFAPSRFGRPFGQAFGGEDWAHTWRATAPQTVVTPFRFGVGLFGEPFRTWGSTLLFCTLNRIKPAQTILQIAFRQSAALNQFKLDRNTLA